MAGIRNAWRRALEEKKDRSQLTEAYDARYRRIWGEAALELGAEIAELPSGYLLVRRGRTSARVWRHLTPLDDGVTLRIALDKPLVHRLVAEAGVRVPEHLEFGADRLEGALRFLKSSNSPCVVKPATGSGGHGATTWIQSDSDLRRARLRAARFEQRLLIERQQPGDVYRLLFLDGELLDVVRRRSPNLVGDGRSTVVGLIAAENRRRKKEDLALPLLRIDHDCRLTLRAAGLTPRSVLAAGKRVTVKTAVSQNAPEDNETFARDVASELIDDARKAVFAVGLRLAGVDVFSGDPTDSAPQQRVVGEVNGTPALHYHYEVRDPRGATRVALPILARILND